MERASGRNVSDLLGDFDQDFDQWIEKSTRTAAAPAPISRSPRPETKNDDLESPSKSPVDGVSERALNRIRSAAREAWHAGVTTAENGPGRSSVNREFPKSTEKTAETPTSKMQESEIASLKGEIERLHKMLEGIQRPLTSIASMHPGADFGLPFDLSFMFQKLTDAGVTVDNTVEILQQAAKEIDVVQIKKRPIVDAWVARWVLGKIQAVLQPWQGRLHLFVGATGSGKTSALVKIASHLVVKEKRKVAILTTDSFKVGAVDQLKIYCQILNVPFAVIRNRKDWDWVLGQLHGVDHVLVDFPGLQLRDLEEIHLMKSLLPPSEAQACCHLTVSATTKDGDAFEIARRYKVAEFNDLIINNLDQSVQHGIIYNLQAKTGKPLHSFGIGSRIPEDFEIATKERVLDLIFKLTKLRREHK